MLVSLLISSRAGCGTCRFRDPDPHPALSLRRLRGNQLARSHWQRVLHIRADGKLMLTQEEPTVAEADAAVTAARGTRLRLGVSIHFTTTGSIG
jgi:hypothetical protein